MNLHLHSHLRPWSKDSAVVDAYRFIGKQVRVTISGGLSASGELVDMLDDRRVVILQSNGFERTSNAPAVRIEVLS